MRCAVTSCSVVAAAGADGLADGVLMVTLGCDRKHVLCGRCAFELVAANAPCSPRCPVCPPSAGKVTAFTTHSSAPAAAGLGGGGGGGGGNGKRKLDSDSAHANVRLGSATAAGSLRVGNAYQPNSAELPVQ